MKEIKREYKTTFIFSTHEKRVMTLADRLVRIEDGAIAMEGVKVESHSAVVIRQIITKFLYIENHDAYMLCPWHIYTETGNWVVHACDPDVGEVTTFIQKKIDARDPFHVETHFLISQARLHNIVVEGWPHQEKAAGETQFLVRYRDVVAPTASP